MTPYSPDFYSNKARKEGYAARSVYKLQEIHKKHLTHLHTYTRVLDLGAAPGSWTQYLHTHISKKGTIYAVDINPLSTRVLSMPRVEFIHADFTEQEFITQLVDVGPFDLVLSDAAPLTSGHKNLDSARSGVLVEACAHIASRTLKEGGILVAKLFQGENSQSVIQDLKTKFSKVQKCRPKAVKPSSFELFVICS